jgi:glutathione S-transferase
MWQAFELAMAKEYRPLMYLRVIGPYDRTRPKEEVMADARRSTDDPSHLDWISRVYDGTAVSEHEAAMLEIQLYHRLDHLERALAGHDFLVGERFTIADLSVLPRVAMYPIVQLPIEAARYPNVRRWVAAVSARPSMVKSESVRPD